MSVEDATERSIARETNLSGVALSEIEGEMDSNLEEFDTASEAVTQTFLSVVDEYPNANVTDLWNYGIYRTYLSSFDGEVDSARQSWRQVSGSAFEHFVVEYYNERLPRFLRLEHVTNTEVRDVVESVTGENAEDVLDAVVMGRLNGEWRIFGGVNTLTSLKGRLSGYASRSQTLSEEELGSFVLTLDSHVRGTGIRSSGELSSDESRQTVRQVLEENDFDGLFSFNEATVEEQDVPIHRVGVTRFYDSFSDQLISDWEEFAEEIRTSQSLRVSL